MPFELTFKRDRIRHIMFDVGGTLLHPVPGVHEVYANVAARYGVLLDPQQVKQTFRQAFQETEQGTPTWQTSEDHERTRWREIVRCCLGSRPIADFDALFDELYAHFADPAAWNLYPDAREALAVLRNAGWPVGLASNFDARLHRICDAEPLLAPLVPRCISSEIGYRKPAPQFYRAVELQCECRADELLLVGDDRIADLEGALQAGWQALWLDRSNSADQFSLHRLTELPEFLGRFAG